MPQALRIYRVEFQGNNITARRIQDNLQTYSPPIALGNNEFITPIRLNENDFNTYLSRYYANFAIMRVEQEDRSEYNADIWRQIIAIVTQAQNNNIQVDFN
jgi:hypothetical protein